MKNDPIYRRFVLIRLDEHGTKFLIEKSLLTRTEAENRLTTILSGQTKPHHQAYEILAYELGGLIEFLEKERIKY